MKLSSKLYLLLIFPWLLISNFAQAQHVFSVKGSQDKICKIKLVTTPLAINQAAATHVLVESFVNEYQKPYLHLTPADIDSKLTSWRGKQDSVQTYYENYFTAEFNDYKNGHLHYWLEAKIDGKLVGWATFQNETTDPRALYMNLLVVLPEHQNQGIGQQLVFAPLHLKEFPKIEKIHLLLRQKNTGGKVFYQKLGFFKNPTYQRADNFVDMKLLEPWTWHRPTH